MNDVHILSGNSAMGCSDIFNHPGTTVNLFSLSGLRKSASNFKRSSSRNL